MWLALRAALKDATRRDDVAENKQALLLGRVLAVGGLKAPPLQT